MLKPDTWAFLWAIHLRNKWERRFVLQTVVKTANEMDFLNVLCLNATSEINEITQKEYAMSMTFITQSIQSHYQLKSTPALNPVFFSRAGDHPVLFFFLLK